MEESKINVAFVGHVDHGKSSILGRLLVETNSLPEGKLEQLQNHCKNHAKDFEYAYLTDALEKEQSQGITIDAARYFLHLKGRKFLFIDTPGHLDFIKNMITGSSTADVAFLIVDAKEGMKENTFRHIFLLSFLQIPKIVVLINKMDSVDYSETVFNQVSNDVLNAFHLHQIVPQEILPISAKHGDNFTTNSLNMPWYLGKCLSESLLCFSLEAKICQTNFRMPLQDIYRFSKEGDPRRIYCGTITAGTLKKGDHLFFSPSQKEAIVESIESELQEPKAGHATGFTLKDPIFVERGELISLKKEIAPFISNRFKVRLFWIHPTLIRERGKYTFCVHTTKISCFIEKIDAVYDSATLKLKEGKQAESYDIIECTIQTAKEIAFDLPPLFIDTTRFVCMDSYEIVCAGVFLENEPLQSKMVRWAVWKDTPANEILSNQLKQKLAEQGKIVYWIRFDEFDKAKEKYFGMLKVCQDLEAICLILAKSWSQETRNSLFKEFDESKFLFFKGSETIEQILKELGT